MATDKQYTVVGISKLNGEYKVRFANDTLRVKVLEKNGHEDVRLCELDAATTKYDAVKQISTMAEFSDAAAQSVIQEYLTEKAPKSKDPAATRKTSAKEVA